MNHNGRIFWLVADLALIVPISVTLLSIGVFQIVSEQVRRLT